MSTDYSRLGVVPIADVTQDHVQGYAREMTPSAGIVPLHDIERVIASMFLKVRDGAMDRMPGTLSLYDDAMAIAPRVPGIADKQHALAEVRARIKERGEQYGCAVLNLMGTWYTSSNVAAKLLRVWDHWTQHKILLTDEVLDIAGYCILNMAILTHSMAEVGQ